MKVGRNPAVEYDLMLSFLSKKTDWNIRVCFASPPSKKDRILATKIQIIFNKTSNHISTGSLLAQPVCRRHHSFPASHWLLHLYGLSRSFSPFVLLYFKLDHPLEVVRRIFFQAVYLIVRKHESIKPGYIKLHVDGAWNLRTSPALLQLIASHGWEMQGSESLNGQLTDTRVVI